MMKYYIFYNGGKIYYSDRGRGTAILLLHGYLESSEIWDSFAVKLAEGFRVISVDLPGHGESSVFGPCHTMEFMAEAIRELVTGLNLKKVFLTGHSLGGYVALAFAEMFPELLSGFCLFHSHPFADPPEAIAKREREKEIVRAGKKFLMYPENVSMMFSEENTVKLPEALKRSKEIAAAVPDEGIIAVLDGMIKRPQRLSVVEEGRVPLLWILGRKDRYISCELVLSKVKLPYGSKAEILEDSGHLGFIEEEDMSLRVLSDFVTGLNGK